MTRRSLWRWLCSTKGPAPWQAMGGHGPHAKLSVSLPTCTVLKSLVRRNGQLRKTLPVQVSYAQGVIDFTLLAGRSYVTSHGRSDAPRGSSSFVWGQFLNLQVLGLESGSRKRDRERERERESVSLLCAVQVCIGGCLKNKESWLLPLVTFN